MRSPQTHIFATRADLIPGLQEAEKALEIIYVRCDGLRPEPDFERYRSLAEWEQLGKNTTGTHIDGYHLLVLLKNSKVEIERVRQKQGGVRYVVDQSLNPDSVSFLPGGIYDGQRILICGHIGTASESSRSIKLYKEFVRLVTARFERIGAYRVGPEAVTLMDEGFRMVTIGITSPREYDLRRSS